MTTYQNIQTTIERLADWQAELQTGPYRTCDAEWAEELQLVSTAFSALLALRHKAFDAPAMEEDVKAYEAQADDEEKDFAEECRLMNLHND